ncbi:TPA: hypothetical protein ACH3X3_002542 [Trebouxia sp. C0006]
MVDWQLTSCLRTDKLFELRGDYKRLEIPRAICVPYDLLEACNPEPALQNLSCGTVISIGSRYTVQEGDTLVSIAQQLSLLGRRVSLSSTTTTSIQNTFVQAKSSLSQQYVEQSLTELSLQQICLT